MGLFDFLRPRPQLKATKTAEELLARHEKHVQAVQDGIKTVQGLIAARATAEEELAEEEVKLAIGEGSQGAVDLARERLDEALVALADAGRRQAAIRAAADIATAGVVEVRGDLATECKAYAESVASEITAEWKELVEVQYKALQQRRRVVERLIGRDLELPDPIPTAQLPVPQERDRPFQILERITALIEHVAATGRRQGGVGPSSAADGRVYVFRREASGFSVGDLIVRETLGDAELAWLIDARWVVPYQPAKVAAAVQAAKDEKLRMQAEFEAELQRAAAERARQNRIERAEEERKDLRRQYPGWTDEQIQKELRRTGRQHVIESAYLTEPSRLQKAVEGDDRARFERIGVVG